MDYILLLLIILNTSLFLSLIFKKNIGQTIFLGNFIYIVILYLSGIFSVMDFGFITIIFLNFLMLLFNIHKYIKKEISIRKNILSTGTLVFICSYFLIVFISHNRFVNEWDEFSHWALAVKNMFNLDNLGLGNDSTILFKDYLSGTSIFQYFCMKISGTYKESMLYIGMDIMILSLLIPITNLFKQKNNYLQYILYIILFFFPTIFYPTIYLSLYVDGILGLTFSYALYSYYVNRKETLSKFDLFNLYTSLTMLVFIKDFGLILMLIVYMIILIDNMFIRNKFKLNLKEIWKNNKSIILSIVFPLLIKITWIITLKINNISGKSAGSVLKTLLNLINLKIEPYQISTIKNFINATFLSKLAGTFLTITYLMLFVIIIVLGYIIINNIKEKHKKSMKILVISTILGFIVYATLLLLAYLSVFSEYEAITIASFTRYMNTYCLGTLFLYIVILIFTFKDDVKKSNNFVIILLLIFIINFDVTPLIIMSTNKLENNRNYASMRGKYQELIYKTNKHLKAKDNLYFIATDTNGYEYYIAKYELTPIKLNEGLGNWSIGNKYSESDIWTIEKTQNEWKEELVKKYDYVYLYKVDEEFIELYGDLFITDKINNNQLYKVDKENGKLDLVE